MARNDEEVQSLRKEISDREAELALLKTQLSRLECQQLPDDNVPIGRIVTPPAHADLTSVQHAAAENVTTSGWRWPLSREEYTRYGRQMITPNISLEGKMLGPDLILP